MDIDLAEKRCSVCGREMTTLIEDQEQCVCYNHFEPLCFDENSFETENSLGSTTGDRFALTLQIEEGYCDYMPKRIDHRELF